jgi:hypothetical protein
LGSLTTRGFLGRLIQVSQVIANDNTVAEQILAGAYPSSANPLPNIAPLPFIYEPGVINYNADMPAGVVVGHVLGDVQIPGFPPKPNPAVDTGYENIVGEFVAYVHLTTGIHRQGVSSDDGFRVTPATGPEDPNNAIVLGEFNGGRGVTDSPYDFVVTQEGLYPMRLIWEQGGGDANVEWWEFNFTDNSYRGINAGAPAGLAEGGPPPGPPAFVPPCTGKTLAIVLVKPNVVISWPIAAGGNQFNLQQTAALASPPSGTVWANVPQVPQNVMGRKVVTIPANLAQRFYRLIRLGPPCGP